MTWLPDPLHPAVVHFVVALSFLALFFELLTLHPKVRQLSPVVPILLVLAALAAVAAVLSGEAAHDEAVIPQAAKALVEQHEELGEKVMVGLIVLAVVRLVLWRMERLATWVRAVWLLLLLAAAAAVGYNGMLGGELVFQHGVGTQLTLKGTPAPAEGEHLEDQ
ncbi:hypothetical protein EG19_05945 [Thermoanaerobaculum aquaticum]|uniref:DUF2231 domain-containing protein n=1 Tax=Thermoanaerobaculum aquaticum TaxID=1312852 RepID=A0A062XV70_9BACT|nr:DUF2231 domain-containing protein [Thermoanaerobaculum aquaticum]KDA53289.1 hypothetical protein EG19_05945 [Thermoanaerobaculum aquaticum]